MLFLSTAAACLLVGVGRGIAMGLSHDVPLSLVHAHLNLLGWTSPALMGLTLRAYPELLRNRPLAWAQYGLPAGSAVVFPAGIYLAVIQDAAGLAIAASLVWLAGAALFLARPVGLMLTREAAAGAPAPARLEPLAGQCARRVGWARGGKRVASAGQSSFLSSPAAPLSSWM